MRYYWNEELVSKFAKVSGRLGIALIILSLLPYYFYGALYWMVFIGILGFAILHVSDAAYHHIPDNIGSYIEMNNEGFRLVKPARKYEIKLTWSEVEYVKFIGGNLHRFCLVLTGNRYQSFYNFKQPDKLLLELKTKVRGGYRNGL